MITALLLAVLTVPQDPALPPAIKASPLQRYVDYSAELERPGVSVLLGRFDKLKEGKRERQADGQLGGAGSVASVSGTQYFKVEATVAVKVLKLLRGEPQTTVALRCELQVARLPDGKERRQARSGAELADGTLALCVCEATKERGKPQRLLQVIPFDARLDGSDDPERVFSERMQDFHAVNSQVAALRAAIAEVDARQDPAARQTALAALQALLDKRPELRRSEDDPLLAMHLDPLEQRARKRLDAGK